MRRALRLSLFFYFLTTVWGESRMLLGKNAKLGQFPYHAILMKRNWIQCGASIIHKRWALTAAHCVKVSGDIKIFTIVVGGIKANGQDGKRHNIESLVIHEKYSSRSLENDIALIRLKTDVEFSKNISPIKLPMNNRNQYVNKMALLSGMGLTVPMGSGKFFPTILQFISIRIIQNKKCLVYWSSLLTSHICTSNELIKSPCSGDSGGPLVVNNVQVGIVSFGDMVCGNEYPSVYTRVSYFVPWIKQKLKKYNDQVIH